MLKRIALALCGIVLSFAAHAQVTAGRNGDFIDSMGVNNHLGFTGTVWQNPTLQNSLMNYLGIFNFRDSAVRAATLSDYKITAAAGAKYLMGTHTGPEGNEVTAYTPGLITAAASLVQTTPGSVIGMEGPNELNTQSVLYLGTDSTTSGVVAANIMVYLSGQTRGNSTLSGAGVLVVNVGLNGGAANANTYVTQEGNLSASVDIGNEHPYPPGGAQPRGHLTSRIAFAQQPVPGKPVYYTETGYCSATGFIGQGVDQATQAKDSLNILFDAWDLGIKKTYLYQLMEGVPNPPSNDCENGYGMFTSTGAPKPLATAIHNMTQILVDNAGNSRSFTPGTLAYSLTGLPAAGHSILLQKASGLIDLVLWNEAPNYNTNTQVPIVVNPTNVTVNLGRSFSVVNVYDPVNGSTPISTASNVTSIVVALADRPLIIEAIAATTSSRLIPGGAVHVVGNQFVSSDGVNIKLAAVGQDVFPTTGSNTQDIAAIAASGNNTYRLSWWDDTTCPGGTCNFAAIDAFVSAATASNIRVIMNHHGQHQGGGCPSKQANGLFYDLNSTTPVGGITWNSTNNTDGCGDAGTTTFAQFMANWVQFATHYNGNNTVIGFDLHNEPLTVGTSGGLATWGTNNGTDLAAGYSLVGGAIHAANPNVLIIGEGPFNFTGTLLNGTAMILNGYGDLSGVALHPITFTGSSSVVAYSVHDYPPSISQETLGTTQAQQTSALEQQWGYIVKNNIAPVWIGALGASLDGDGPDNTCGGCATQETNWAAWLVSFMTGGQGGNGGPTFTAGQQSIGGDWRLLGDFAPTGAPSGMCGNAACTAPFKPVQQATWIQLLQDPIACAPPTTASIIWNTCDQSGGYLLSNSNITATNITSPPQGIRSKQSFTTGKFCFAVVATAITDNWQFGLADALWPTSSVFLGAGTTHGIAFSPNSPPPGNQGIFINNVLVSGGTGVSANGDTHTMCVDFGAQLLWASSPVMVAAGNVWNNAVIGTANPATGIGGISFSLFACPCYIAANEPNSGGAFTINATGPFPPGTPSGFTSMQAATNHPIITIFGQRDVAPELSYTNVGYSTGAIH